MFIKNIKKQNRDHLLNKVKETLESEKRSIIIFNSEVVSIKKGIISAVEKLGLKIQQISIPNLELSCLNMTSSLQWSLFSTPQ